MANSIISSDDDSCFPSPLPAGDVVDVTMNAPNTTVWRGTYTQLIYEGALNEKVPVPKFLEETAWSDGVWGYQLRRLPPYGEKMSRRRLLASDCWRVIRTDMSQTLPNREPFDQRDREWAELAARFISVYSCRDGLTRIMAARADVAFQRMLRRITRGCKQRDMG